MHIRIPESLEFYYESWRNPKAFLTLTQTGLDGPWSVSRVYSELRNIRQRKTYDPIRERIFAVALYNLRETVMEFYGSMINQKGWKERIAEIILESPLVRETKDRVLGQVKVYLRFGKRMKRVADCNGGLGALMVMPSDLLSATSSVSPHYCSTMLLIISGGLGSMVLSFGKAWSI